MIEASYITGYLCYQHSSSASPQTRVITKISYSYCDITITNKGLNLANLATYFNVLYIHCDLIKRDMKSLCT